MTTNRSLQRDQLETLVNPISNVLQLRLEDVGDMYVNVDLQRNPASFLLIEVCGYQHGVPVVLGWSA